MILCFEIGGSRMRAALSVGGGLEPLGEVATPDGLAAFLLLLREFLRPGVRGVAVSIAGVVDPANGRLRVANIPCLDRLVLAAEIETGLGVPVVVVNDADCFALAEAVWGAGRGYATVFGIILGSGVGGGLVMNGKVVTGAGGYAGEWGHGPVVTDPALRCGCGLVGCLDTVGGARGLERLHLALHGVVAGSEAIVEGWEAGEALPGVTVSRWVELVAGPLAMVLNVVGAGIVPVGGGLGRAPALIAELDRAVRARVLRAAAGPLVVPAGISVDAGLIGAAAAGAAAFAG